MSDTPTNIAVRLERSSDQWLATAPSLQLSTTGHSTSSARTRIANAVKQHHGEAEIDFQLMLPVEQRAALDKYETKRRPLLHALADATPAQRCPVAEQLRTLIVQTATALITIHLSQREVCDLMGLASHDLKAAFEGDSAASREHEVET